MKGVLIAPVFCLKVGGAGLCLDVAAAYQSGVVVEEDDLYDGVIIDLLAYQLLHGRLWSIHNVLI